MVWAIAPRWWKRNQEERWRAGVKAAMGNQPSPYYRDLLALSANLIVEGRHEVAVIVAQMACEVLAEQVLTPLLKGQEAPWNFNLHGDKVLKLYTKLTRDAIHKTPFWDEYGNHAVRRHEAVHHGRRVSPTEAQASFSVATRFVGHVESVQRNLA